MYKQLKNIRKKLRLKWMDFILPHNMRHLRYILPHLHVTHHDDTTKSYVYKKNFVARSKPISLIDGYRSENIYLIGSGPSILSQDLTKLKDQTVILMNGSFHLIETYSFHQAIYVITDFYFIEQNPDIVLKALLSDVVCIFPSECLRAICEINPQALRDSAFIISEEIGRHSTQAKPSLLELQKWADFQNDIHYDFKQSTEEQQFGFSFNPAIGYINCGTVMYAALQFAAYLKPKSVYMMGLDISNAHQPRFYEIGKKMSPSRLTRDYYRVIEPAFAYAQDLLSKNQIEMYNLSPVSKLPTSVVPFLEYKAAIKRSTFSSSM